MTGQGSDGSRYPDDPGTRMAYNKGVVLGYLRLSWTAAEMKCFAARSPDWTEDGKRQAAK